MSSNWPKVLVIWLAAASQISVPPANFVAMSVTNRVSPIVCHQFVSQNVSKWVFVADFISRPYFDSEVSFSNFSFYPEFSVYVLQSEKKIFVNFFSVDRGQMRSLASNLFFISLIKSSGCWWQKRSKLSSTYFATKIHHQHRYFQPLQTMHFISENKISAKKEKDFWTAELAGRLKYWYHFVTV